MRRVVPSQARENIQTVFGNEIDPDWDPPKELSAKLAGVLTICEGLPDELLTGPDYAKYTFALATIKYRLEAWHHHPDPPNLGKISGKNPLSIIYSFLEQCPDEFPSPSTITLAFVADPALRNSIRLDISAANHDLENHVYKGATVLAGSAMEALLLWTINEQKKTVIDDASKRLKIDKQLEWWGLSELIRVAHYLKLIEDETATQADLSKDFRNLIHPGRAKRLEKSCGRGTAHAALAAVEFVARDLGVASRQALERHCR